MRLENHIVMLEMHDLVPFKVSEKLYNKKKKKICPALLNPLFPKHA